MRAVEKLLQSLIKNRDIFKHPKPEDRRLLLSRLVKRRKRCYTTVLQYMKWYNAILWHKGQKPSPDLFTYSKLIENWKRVEPDNKREPTRV
jgi:hypothetical protein